MKKNTAAIQGFLILFFTFILYTPLAIKKAKRRDIRTGSMMKNIPGY